MTGARLVQPALPVISRRVVERERAERPRKVPEPDVRTVREPDAQAPRGLNEDRHPTRRAS